MDEIKIAHITTIDKSINFLLLNQLLSIKSAGFSVYGISSPGPYVKEIELKGIRHIAVSIPRNIKPFDDVKAIWELYQIIRREKFTIVHTHFSKPGMIGQVAARIAGVPIIINTIHGFAFHKEMGKIQKQFYIYLEKIAASCSTLILSQNHDDMTFAIKEGICPKEKIKHLGNGIDLSRFDPQRIDPLAQDLKRRELCLESSSPVIGFVGRLAKKRKGFSDFLESAKKIVEVIPQAKFLIIGEEDQGRPDAAAPELAKLYGVQDHCRFVGWVPNEQIPLLISLVNILVLPSSLEGMPRSLMEGSAMGIPIVATDVKGNRDVVIHGRNGFLVPYANPTELSKAILDLINNPIEARFFGQEGYKLAHEKFDEQTVFEIVISEYRNLLVAKGIPSSPNYF